MIYSGKTRKTSAKQNTKGFTLIELLVVIDIIAILAAILFPVFARARENARRASCMSNLKQIGLGIMQYTQDYDEKYPCNWGDCTSNTPTVYVTDTSSPGYKLQTSPQTGGGVESYFTWMDFIHPYVKSTQVFVCPSATYSATAPSYGYSGAIGGYSRYIYAGITYSVIREAASLAEIQRPAEVYMIMDYNSPYGYNAGVADVPLFARGTDVQKQIVTPHLEGGNYAYADGHVKWQTRSKVASVVITTTGCPSSTTYCDRNWNPYIN